MLDKASSDPAVLSLVTVQGSLAFRISSCADRRAHRELAGTLAICGFITG